jgi:hypothetical protein
MPFSGNILCKGVSSWITINNGACKYAEMCPRDVRAKCLNAGHVPRLTKADVMNLQHKSFPVKFDANGVALGIAIPPMTFFAGRRKIRIGNAC